MRPSGRRLATGIAAALAAASAVAPVFAAVYLTVPLGYDAAGYNERWDLAKYPDGVPFLVHPTVRAGGKPIQPSPVSEERLIRIARNAFAAWEDVETSGIRLTYAGTTDSRNGYDGENVVTFDPDPAISYPPGMISETYVWFQPSRGNPQRAPGEIIEADILVHTENATFRIYDGAPASTDTAIDLLGVLTHEVGHFIGLEHNGLAGSVLYGAFALGLHFPNRSLEEDDAAGASVLYPTGDFLSTMGIIEGRVRRADGTPVFGAHVTAVDTTTGAIRGCASTGLAEIDADGLPVRFSLDNGLYRIHGLPPGTYQVVAEPLDGPLSPNVLRGGIWVEADLSFAVGRSGSIAATAGAVASADITVGARATGAPNMGEYAFWSPDGRSFLGPAYGLRGTTPVFAFARGEGLADQDAIQFSGPGIEITGRAADVSFFYLWARIDASAPLGPRLLTASNAKGETVLAGAVEILDGTAEVTGLSPAEGSVDGGEVISILGNRFLGDRVVFVGETSARVLEATAGEIRIVLPPSDAEGPVSVVVCTDVGCAASPTPLTYLPSQGSRFVRGDINADGVFDLGDAIGILSVLFVGTPTTCLDACDADDDGILVLSDPIFLLTYLFGAGSAPSPPFPSCGLDPEGAADGLDCAAFPGCP
ncbi:MAG: matrixin family metalloprotease [Planctomycetes bacterium]|nr:matrixin family metalloprotease [Planctomycetota bacterium]